MEHELAVGADTIVVGHSSGAVAAMRYAETHHVVGDQICAYNYHQHTRSWARGLPRPARRAERARAARAQARACPLGRSGTWHLVECAHRPQAATRARP